MSACRRGRGLGDLDDSVGSERPLGGGVHARYERTVRGRESSTESHAHLIVRLSDNRRDKAIHIARLGATDPMRVVDRRRRSRVLGSAPVHDQGVPGDEG